MPCLAFERNEASVVYLILQHNEGQRVEGMLIEY
jgi:hypothetical protein